MIDKESFHPLKYIEKEEYSGSMQGMRYMLKSVKSQNPETGEETKQILVTVWPEPFGINATPEENKIKEYFPLDEDGVSDAADWINKQFFDLSDRWKAALEAGLNWGK